MGALDLKGKASQMPKDPDDRKLADLFKKLDPKQAKALESKAVTL